jgi:TM2 domain-containing membrane protein YozV
MGNLILPHSITKNLPFAITTELASLPEEAQREFFDEYNLRVRSVVLSYVLHLWVFGTHNLYLGKWVRFILYAISCAMVIPGAIWWLIDLFRIPSMVEEYNNKLAEEILRDVMVKHRLFGRKEKKMEIINESPSFNPGFKIVKPRDFHTSAYDPTNISIESIKTGFILDFDIKTWEVTSERQYDWDNGNTEKEFKLASATNNEFIFVILTKEARQVSVQVGKPVNVFSIDANIESEIQTKGRPYNVLLFDGVTYYREGQNEGIVYNMNDPQTQGQRLRAWDYFDTNRENHLRITETGRGDYKAVKTRAASPYEFTDIYPKD